MAKQSKSQRIRTLLAQGKSVKEIVKTVKCHPGLVYQVKSYDKSKEVKAKKWKAGNASASVTPVLDRTTGKQWSAGQIYQISQPRDYYQRKPSLFQRVKNFFLGC